MKNIIDYNKIYTNKSGKYYKIIEDLGIKIINNRTEHRVIVLFICSGNSYETSYEYAINGLVGDRQSSKKVDMASRIYQTINSGPYKILGYTRDKNNNLTKMDIQFINTGSVITTNRSGYNIKDPALPIGSRDPDFNINRFDNYESFLNSRLKTIRKNMIKRCYDKKCQYYYFYGGIGIGVSTEWLESEDIFLSDARLLDGFNKFYNLPNSYDLDKDYKQLLIPKGQRIYSKETCMFLYYQDNINLRVIDTNNEKYHGVEINQVGNYLARITNNGERYNIGTFTNAEVAACAYNYFYEYFHNYELVPLFNDVPMLPLEELLNYTNNTQGVIDSFAKIGMKINR